MNRNKPARNSHAAARIPHSWLYSWFANRWWRGEGENKQGHYIGRHLPSGDPKALLSIQCQETKSRTVSPWPSPSPAPQKPNPSLWRIPLVQIYTYDLCCAACSVQRADIANLLLLAFPSSVISMSRAVPRTQESKKSKIEQGQAAGAISAMIPLTCLSAVLCSAYMVSPSPQVRDPRHSWI